MGLFSKEETVNVTLLTGATLACQVCDNDRFFLRKGQLNTALRSVFNLDWADPTAECVICARCGFIHWFVGTKKKAKRKSRA